VLLAAPAPRGQLAFNEVLVDPVGSDTGKQIIELVNTTGSSFTPGGWYLCAPFAYVALPAIAVPSGGIVRLHVNMTGTDTPTDWYTGLLRDLLRRDTLVLYKSANFTVSTDIVDFVSWGGGTNRANQAVSVGQWPSIGATVPVPPEGFTIAWMGAGDAPSAWFRDGSPTLGAANGSGTVSLLGAGCPTSAGVPVLLAPSPAVDGNIDFVLAAGALPNAGVAFLIGVQPAGGVPVLGCPIESLPIVAPPRIADASGVATLLLPHFVPGSSLVGATLYYQALVGDALAPNGLFGATPGLRVVVGG
jgi:hypothetical protein